MGMIPQQQGAGEDVFPKIRNISDFNTAENQGVGNITFSDCSLESCVGIVDIVNSTKIAATLSGAKMSKYYGIFLNTMSAIVQKYGGRIVKNVGDSILFYFPTSKSKLELTKSLECALTMSLAHDEINKILYEEDLPCLNYRISLDYGSVVLAKFSTSSCEDIFGTPVNMCSKINSSAKPNTVVIGSDLYEVIKGLDYCFEEIKGYSVGFKYQYPIFILTHNNANNAALVASAIEQTLADIGSLVLEEVIRRLFNDCHCFLSDCYERPECLKKILQDLYGASYEAILQSLANKLQEHFYKKPMIDFLEKMA
jgi:class 3 adenylate cyclase